VRRRVDDFTDIAPPPESNLQTAPSQSVVPPRIASAPVRFECRLYQSVDPGPAVSVFIREVLVTRVRDEFVLDREKLRLDTDAMWLIGRMHGPRVSLRTTDRFEMVRP
jgi:flavin reductase (DIM6/NTAB) family NADH-FMN oxidoreductase RutF